MTRETTAAPRGDQIHCDDSACSARLLTRTELSQTQSVDFARDCGWQAWMGTLRAYHRCPAHPAEWAGGMPARGAVGDGDDAGERRDFEHEVETRPGGAL